MEKGLLRLLDLAAGDGCLAVHFSGGTRQRLVAPCFYSGCWPRYVAPRSGGVAQGSSSAQLSGGVNIRQGANKGSCRSVPQLNGPVGCPRGNPPPVRREGDGVHAAFVPSLSA